MLWRWLIASLLLLPLAGQSHPAARLQNRWLTVTASGADGGYTFGARATGPTIAASAAAHADGRWLRAADYPRHVISRRPFSDALGAGEELLILNTGLPARPDLHLRLRLYSGRAYGSIRLALVNHTEQTAIVSDLRLLDAARLPLGGPDAADRLLPDSYSEDRPVLRIFDFGRPGNYRAIGSELIYNRASGWALFFGALTSRRFLTYLRAGNEHTAQGPRLAPFTIDSAGTTAVQRDDALRGAPAADQIELRLPVAPGASLASETVLFSLRRDAQAALTDYGAAIRAAHEARAATPNLLGWWSWTAYYFGLNQGMALTNARWLAQHLRRLGYRYFHIDEGYQYARGEYTTANAAQFPAGMAALGRQLGQLGLRFGLWTAPFEVSSRAWVYQHHREWLVRNAAGQPIPIGAVGTDRLYVLDATNPGAQEYLRQTYRTLMRQWGVRYLKLDFMDDTAIEGDYFRPHTTALEAQRIGLRVIREAVGPGVILDKDGSPMLNSVGLVDAGRISVDTGHAFAASRDAASGIAARFYMNRNFFLSDPDAFSVSEQLIPDQSWHQSRRPLTLDEARVAIALAAVSGGMFEIGDDLPTLGAEPDRLALVENRDLLDAARLSRAAIPVDLMDYAAADEQPSIFLLPESRRQALLAVFNWTGAPRDHRLVITAGAKGWSVQPAAAPAAGAAPLLAGDVFAGGAGTRLESGVLELPAQAPHTVRLFKLIAPGVAAAPPAFKAEVPATGHTGAALAFQAQAQDQTANPVLDWHWDFGDGTSAQGALVCHAYTRPQTYTVTLSAGGLDGESARQTYAIAVTGGFSTQFAPERNRRFVPRAAPATGCP